MLKPAGSNALGCVYSIVDYGGITSSQTFLGIKRHRVQFLRVAIQWCIKKRVHIWFGKGLLVWRVTASWKSGLRSRLYMERDGKGSVYGHDVYTTNDSLSVSVYNIHERVSSRIFGSVVLQLCSHFYLSEVFDKNPEQNMSFRFHKRLQNFSCRI